MFYYKKAKLIRYVLICSIFFFSTIGFGQSTINTDSLKTIRTQLIAANQSTTEIDLLLHQAGSNPTCIIQQLNDRTFKFIPYQGTLDEQREQRMNLRLKSYFSYLNTIDFSDNFTSVTINCTENLTPQIINELISHFGYYGYEIH
jgi:hypothetical protein